MVFLMLLLGKNLCQFVGKYILYIVIEISVAKQKRNEIKTSKNNENYYNFVLYFFE